jgi:SDR family mycofactocin-dependent oxidoreductase
MGKFEGKVVFITGVARGQGRSHAIRFAEEGADVIGVDICAQIETVEYPMATPEDLAETVAAVERLDRRIVAHQVDVRDYEATRTALHEGVAELGRLDFVLANAGIGALGTYEHDRARAFRETIEVNLTGVWNSIDVALPILTSQGTGGSIVITSSTGGLKGYGGVSGGGQAYTASKHAAVGLMRNLALNYAAQSIRVNTVHPTGVDTPMIMNEAMQRVLTESPDLIGAMANPMPVQVLAPRDISHAMVWLCSDEARYVTGVALPVDAGLTIK